MAELERLGSPRAVAGLARFALPMDRTYGVGVGQLKVLARRIGKDHRLALALWKNGWRDARMLACLIDDPALVTAKQMDEWCRAFDNWGICDTACFTLFDRTPHAWTKVKSWSALKPEYQRRAAFALLWGLTVHDKSSGDAPFLNGLKLIVRAGDDDRRYVKMAANMALRAIGKRNRSLHAAALRTARLLARGSAPAGIWIGKDAIRELESASVQRRLAGRRAQS